MPRRYDDYDDRPRKSKRKKGSSGGPGPVAYVGGGVAFVVCFAVAFFLVQRLTGGAKPGAAGDAVGAPAPKGVKYVPHESEQKFSAFLKTRPDQDGITEAEVYAIMGEPTRREHVFTGMRNGIQMTVYEAHWDVPGSGISSSIDFVNGKTAGMVIGLKTK
jgi:hypothetical protein